MTICPGGYFVRPLYAWGVLLGQTEIDSIGELKNSERRGVGLLQRSEICMDSLRQS